MLATVQTKLRTDFSAQNLNLKVLSVGAVAQRDSENSLAEAGTWDTYLSTLRQATVEAISAKKIAQRDYLTILAEVDTSQRRLEIALNNDCKDLVRKALWRRNACRNSARSLKALVEKHSLQVSILKDQLAFWENQLETQSIPRLRLTPQSRGAEAHRRIQWHELVA